MDTAEKPHMSQLIHFVVSDGLNPQLLCNIHQIVLRRCNRRNSGPRKLIFDVDANLYAKSGLPARLQAARISRI